MDAPAMKAQGPYFSVNVGIFTFLVPLVDEISPDQIVLYQPEPAKWKQSI
jgi:hypothetical protein